MPWRGGGGRYTARRTGNPLPRTIPIIFLLLALSGCVERTLTVNTSPPGALVYLNDQEFGRTPVDHRFLWYGTYEVEVRKEGYQTLKTEAPVIAPWWQWVPFDLVAELFPARLQDHHTVSFALAPLKAEHVDPEAIVQRGESLREQLESTRMPNPPQTQPTTRPVKR